MKVDVRRKRQVLYYLCGAALCMVSLLFRIYWVQNGAGGESGVQSFLRSLIGGLPWISVAIVILLWRSKGEKVHPVAFLFGTATPLVLAYLWLLRVGQGL